MALDIKNLAAVSLTGGATVDIVYPGSSFKATLIKRITLTNANPSVKAVVNLYVVGGAGATQVSICPTGLEIPPLGSVSLDFDITLFTNSLGAADIVKAHQTVGTALWCTIFGYLSDNKP